MYSVLVFILAKDPFSLVWEERERSLLYSFSLFSFNKRNILSVMLKDYYYYYYIIESMFLTVGIFASVLKSTKPLH